MKIFTYFPVFINYSSDEENFRITFGNNVYILDKLRVYDVLAKINMLFDFVEDCANKKDKSVAEWFKKKGLLNKNFLEVISLYKFSKKGKKTEDCIRFLEDEKLTINFETMIRNSFKSAEIYQFLSKNKDMLNYEAVCLIKEIEQGFIEFSFSNFSEKLLNRLNYKPFENLDLMEVSIETRNSIDKFLSVYEEVDFSLLNEVYSGQSSGKVKESIKEKTVLKFDVEGISGNSLIDYIKISEIFTSEFMKFQKSYLKNFAKTAALKDKTINIEKSANSNHTSRGGVALKKDYVEDLFFDVECANCLANNLSWLKNCAIILNLESEILKRLNFLFDETLLNNFIKMGFALNRKKFRPINYYKLQVLSETI